MNVAEINPGTKGTLPHYVITVIPLTLFTIWLVIAFQSKYHTAGQTWTRFLWPVMMAKQFFTKKSNVSRGRSTEVTAV
jgi:hypothetical protein